MTRRSKLLVNDKWVMVEGNLSNAGLLVVTNCGENI